MQSQIQPPTDDALLQAWRAGDRRAGGTLVRRHWKGISRYFTSKLGHNCEDLIQDTFAAAVEGVERYRGDSCFRAYLFGIARFKLLRHLRRRASATKIFDPRTVSLAQVMPSYTSAIAAGQKREKLMLAMSELPLDTQTMLELHYWEHMRIREIAAVVEMPVDTVKSRMRRGRIQLAKALAA